MRKCACAAAALAAIVLATGARANDPQESCKKAMNTRIQTCADACTKAALAAASDYVDKNNNVKFGCLKGCALRQIQQMRNCTAAGELSPDDPTETNR